MKKYLVLFFLVALVSFGCKQRAITQPETQQPQKEEQAAAGQKKAGEEVTEKNVPSKVESVESKEMPTETAEKEGVFEDVHFDFDKYDVKDEYKPELKKISAWMTKNPEAKLSIEGHTDDRGTNEYNLALGDRRAKAVKDYLVSLGVPSSRIETISFGEEKPLCAEHTEECWAKNRRAHFVVLQKPGK
jgi:peptidoglycan-associated lipoprotein